MYKHPIRLKSILTVFAAAVLLTGAISGCTGSDTKAPDMDTLQADMLAADSSLPDMLTISDASDGASDLFQYLSDVDYDKVDSFFLSYSSDGLSYEIAVVRMKDSADVSAMETSLEEHVQGRVNLYRSYNQDQVSRAESAEIFTEGNDVVLIMCDNSSLIRQAYDADCSES